VKKYLYVVKMQILRSFVYSFNVYGNIIIQSIIMITSVFFWKALYRNTSTVSGVDIEGMMTYIVMSSMLSVILFTNVERRIEGSVEKGTVAVDLMKPVNIFLVYFAEDMGSVIALVFQNLIPIFVIASLLIKVPKMTDISYLPLFIVAVIESALINWIISALFGLWSFTAVNIDALIQVKKHLIRLLSGSIIPLWFFPDWFRGVLEYLPFAYIYQLPLSIYIGRGDRAEIIRQMSIQSIWLLLLFVAFVLIGSRTTNKVMVQGG